MWLRSSLISTVFIAALGAQATAQPPSGSMPQQGQQQSPMPQQGQQQGAMPQQGMMPQQDQQQGPASQPGQRPNPATILEDRLKDLQEFVSRGGARNIALLDRFIEEKIAPSFDFSVMTRYVLSPYYDKLGPQEKAVFADRVEDAFLGVLAVQLSSLIGPIPQVDFAPPRQTGPEDAEVRALVLTAQEKPMVLNFKFKKGQQGWKVYDVSANGISAAYYLRKRFIEELREQRRGAGPNP